MIRNFFFILSILFLISCTSQIPANTGIEGRVTIGPVCPVVQANNPCPDRPYQASLTVLGENGKKVMNFKTDANGQFQVALRPGRYILRPESPNVMPHAVEQPFVVETGRFTLLTVTYDSGIR